MKEIINGQTVKIDNHDSGSGRAISFDKGIHIHKIMNKDRYNGAEILIPLNEKQDISFRKVKGKNSLIESQLKKEISRAFKDSKKRSQFAKDLFKIIEQYSHGETNAKKNQNLITGAKSIAEHFDLFPEIKKEVINNIKNRITTYYTEHVDENGTRYYIFQDLEGRNIRIGSDLDILRDWDETVRLFDQ